jgi:hypothetical protein
MVVASCEEWLQNWPPILSQHKALVAALYRREVRSLKGA